MPLSTICLPVRRLWQYSVAKRLQFLRRGSHRQLVRFLSVASPVGQLKIVNVAGVAPSIDRYNVIYARTQWMRIFLCEIHRSSADPTGRL